ncbi:unnamed protein product [Absidia cylindrospora]
MADGLKSFTNHQHAEKCVKGKCDDPHHIFESTKCQRHSNFDLPSKMNPLPSMLNCLCPLDRLTFLFGATRLLLEIECFDIMEEAYKKGNVTDILAMNILAPRSRQLLDHLDSVLQDLFSTQDIFRQSWTNSALESSATMKPDWLNDIIPLTYQDRYCNLYEDIYDRHLQDGYESTTKDDMIFYHIPSPLSKALLLLITVSHPTVPTAILYSQQSDLGLFRCLYHIKTLAAMVAQKVKNAQLDRTRRKRKLPWCSSKVLDITKQKRIDT